MVTVLRPEVVSQSFVGLHSSKKWEKLLKLNSLLEILDFGLRDVHCMCQILIKKVSTAEDRCFLSPSLSYLLSSCLIVTHFQRVCGSQKIINNFFWRSKHPAGNFAILFNSRKLPPKLLCEWASYRIFATFSFVIDLPKQSNVHGDQSNHHSFLFWT